MAYWYLRFLSNGVPLLNQGTRESEHVQLCEVQYVVYFSWKTAKNDQIPSKNLPIKGLHRAWQALEVTCRILCAHELLFYSKIRAPKCSMSAFFLSACLTGFDCVSDVYINEGAINELLTWLCAVV